MSRAIDALLNRATLEQRLDGAVSTSTAMLLAAEGYELSALAADVQERIEYGQEA